MSLPTTLTGLEQLVSAMDARERLALLSGRVATQVFLALTDASDGIAGDCVCLGQVGPVPPTSPTVTKALAAALANAGSVFGVLLEPIARGASGYCAVLGAIPPAMTGLGALSGLVKVDPSTGRCSTVVALTDGDYAVGTVDSVGNLTLTTIRQLSASQTGGMSLGLVYATARGMLLP